MTRQRTFVLFAVQLPVARLPARPGLVVASALSRSRLATEAVGQQHLKANRIT